MFAFNALLNRVGMLFEKPLPFSISSYENMPYGVRFYERLSRSQMDERVTYNMR